jgi:hypothetical protein
MAVFRLKASKFDPAVNVSFTTFQRSGKPWRLGKGSIVDLDLGEAQPSQSLYDLEQDL